MTNTVVAAVIYLAIVYWLHSMRDTASNQGDDHICYWCKKPIEENQPAIHRGKVPQTYSLDHYTRAHLECEKNQYQKQCSYAFFLMFLLFADSASSIGVLHSKMQVTFHNVLLLLAFLAASTSIYTKMKQWRGRIDEAKAAVAVNEDSEKA